MASTGDAAIRDFGSGCVAGLLPRHNSALRDRAVSCVFLDRKNVLIADEDQAKGTVVDHVPVCPREVARRALESNASALILVHTHPSGDDRRIHMKGRFDL